MKASNWTFTYMPDDTTEIEYLLLTDPPEAIYWKTYKLKKSHIKLLTKVDRSQAAELRSEILEDILRTET